MHLNDVKDPGLFTATGSFYGQGHSFGTQNMTYFDRSVQVFKQLVEALQEQGLPSAIHHDLSLNTSQHWKIKVIKINKNFMKKFEIVVAIVAVEKYKIKNSGAFIAR